MASSITNMSKIDTRPILLICGCKAYDIYLRAAIRRFRWDAKWRVVGCMGSDDTDVPAVYDASSNILTVPVPDTYEALPVKIHCAVEWIRKTWSSAPGIFKTDDDILVSRLEELSNAIDTHGPTVPYWGFVTHRCHRAYVPLGRIKYRFTDTTFRPKHQAATYCFGHGYWLRADAADIVIRDSAEYEISYLEDVCTGYVLNKAGIMPERIMVEYREMPRTTELLRYVAPPLPPTD